MSELYIQRDNKAVAKNSLPKVTHKMVYSPLPWFLLLEQTPSFFTCLRAMPLEVLLAPYETEARLRVHVALDVERRTKTLGATEEDTSLGR
jgi:hypothetical protein